MSSVSSSELIIVSYLNSPVILIPDLSIMIRLKIVDAFGMFTFANTYSPVEVYEVMHYDKILAKGQLSTTRFNMFLHADQVRAEYRELEKKAAELKGENPPITGLERTRIRKALKDKGEEWTTVQTSLLNYLRSYFEIVRGRRDQLVVRLKHVGAPVSVRELPVGDPVGDPVDYA